MRIISIYIAMYRIKENKEKVNHHSLRNTWQFFAFILPKFFSILFVTLSTKSSSAGFSCHFVFISRHSFLCVVITISSIYNNRLMAFCASHVRSPWRYQPIHLVQMLAFEKRAFQRASPLKENSARSSKIGTMKTDKSRTEAWFNHRNSNARRRANKRTRFTLDACLSIAIHIHRLEGGEGRKTIRLSPVSGQDSAFSNFRDRKIGDEAEQSAFPADKFQPFSRDSLFLSLSPSPLFSSLYVRDALSNWFRAMKHRWIFSD